jgi:sortase (surface protein transpeptidase)
VNEKDAMMRDARSAVRIVGALIVVAALAAWVAVGTPRLGAAEFGVAPAASITDVAAPAPEAAPEAAPEVAPDPARDTPTATPPPAPTPPAPTPPAAEPSPFTTTAPRGPIDITTWPTAVRIPRLGVDAPVEPVGVGTQGELIIPHSPMDVGWYQGGSVPGEAGVALLTSHVDTRTEGRGVFAGLVRLDAGDVVTTVAADGTEQRWTVTARTQHLKTDLPQALFARSGPPVLALVTCGGPFDATVRSYRDNVIVWAEPVP